MENRNSHTITVSLKVSALQKIRYYNIAKSHNISFSEWAGSILSIYENGYGELKINSCREDELLNRIDQLEKDLRWFKAHNEYLKSQLDAQKTGMRFHR
ncbi:hypothetical protein [Yeosuana marina]|uniref:hypothetical protein n=1 Tax=Yeosuana marina TaxID=1565536 RepID=UPI0030C7C8ED